MNSENYKVSKFSKHSCQISISCFLEDLDAMFKIFKKQLDEPALFFGVASFSSKKRAFLGMLRFIEII